jgi:hypothetical protein
MSDELGLAGTLALGTLAAAATLLGACYTATRLFDWLSEHFGRVSVTLLSHGIASCADPRFDMLTVKLRVYNPKATPRRMTKATLVGGPLGLGLAPVKESHAAGLLWFDSDAQSELPPKRHREFLLGHTAKEGLRAPPEPTKVWVTIRLDDGQIAKSKPFDIHLDWWRAWPASAAEP